MLNLTPTPNTHRQADNLIPLENNQYETRPGFFQVASGAITAATGWMEEKSGSGLSSEKSGSGLSS